MSFVIDQNIINFDFKKNWDIVLPLLSTPKMKKAIKRGIQRFIKSGQCHIKEYDSSLLPYEYGRLSDEISIIEEEIAERLIKTGYLKPCPDPDDPEDPHSPESEEKAEKYFKERSEFIDPFIHINMKNSLRGYQMFSACHWWNPTFGLTLARIVYPNENWRIMSGYKTNQDNENDGGHTTIINDKGTMTFDILYFDESSDSNGAKKIISDTSSRRRFLRY